MARVRTAILKSFLTGVSPTSKMQTFRSYSSCMNFSNRDTKRWRPFGNIWDTHMRMQYPTSFIDIQRCKSDPVTTSSPRCLQNKRLAKTMLHCQGTLFPIFINGRSPYRTFSSDRSDDNTDVVGSNWVDSLKLAWESAVNAAVYTGNKLKEASDELTPYVQKTLDSYPYLKEVIIPVSGTVSAALLAWLVMPRILKRLHKYSMQGPAALLYGKLPEEQVPYEKSFWGALEDPVRYLITFMAFSQLAVMIAPTTIASQYIAQAWRGAIILSFVWFLYRWKTNVFTRALATQNITGLDRERLLALDKISSVGLFVLGLMAAAEASGVAVQSVLTVGGIGGVATAFAARDILGNVLSGLSMQFSRPFSMGDTIKLPTLKQKRDKNTQKDGEKDVVIHGEASEAGSIEGQVIEMGLTTTSLLSSEKFPVTVPNSLFSSQVIVNKSRAQWRAMKTKIPVRIGDVEKIPQVSEDIKSMLRSNSKVFLEKEAPYCFLSRIETSHAELTIGCNLKHMRRDELFSTEQDILVKAAQIIKQHGVELGGTDCSNYS